MIFIIIMNSRRVVFGGRSRHFRFLVEQIDESDTF